jgi:hypothetical protein
MKPQAGGELGLHMDKMDGILVLPWNITAVIRFISRKTRGDRIVETVEFPPEKSLYHFLQLTIWPLKPQRISRTPYYIRNRQAHFVRSATNK